MRSYFKFICTLVLFIVLLFGAFGQASANIVVIYVKWNAPGADNGTSWTDAYTSLQAALAAATTVGEIWVAAGTYKPTTSSDRKISFVLKNGVGIYGGFNGTETLRTQRDPATNLTRLSGDIGVIHDWSDNSYNVVYSASKNSSAVLDGFTIYAGNANGTTLHYGSGGGLYNQDGSPTLANLIFSENYTTGKGGGMFNATGNSSLTNVTFSKNQAKNTGTGGGMFNMDSLPSLTNVTFDGNTTEVDGGGMYNDNSSPSLTNATFHANQAGNAGGGMVNTSSSPTLTNVTFNGNSATFGGGMLNFESSSPSLTNVTFSGNDVDGMYNFDGAPEIYDSIFWGNGSEIVNEVVAAEIHDSIVEGGCPANSSSCSNILDLDPNLGALANNGGATQTMALPFGSSAMDAGNNGTCATTDQRGVTRPQGLKCDMGAFELVIHNLFLPLILRNN